MSIGCIFGSHGIRENRYDFPLLPIELVQVKHALVQIIKSLPLFLGSALARQNPANQALNLHSIRLGHNWYRKPIERIDYILVVTSPLELRTSLVKELPDRKSTRLNSSHLGISY